LLYNSKIKVLVLLKFRFPLLQGKLMSKIIFYILKCFIPKLKKLNITLSSKISFNIWDGKNWFRKVIGTGFPAWKPVLVRMFIWYGKIAVFETYNVSNQTVLSSSYLKNVTIQMFYWYVLPIYCPLVARDLF